MIPFLIRMLELFGVIFLRFRPVPRLWCVWLVGVNVACLWFITHIEAQVVLAVTAIAVAGQTLIYQRIGFTRILGATHILWLPMFAWMAMRIDTIMDEPGLATGSSCCSPRTWFRLPWTQPMPFASCAASGRPTTAGTWRIRPNALLV